VSELEDKLNALLSNPESMAQVMQLAQSLSGQAKPPPQAETPPAEKSPPAPERDAAILDPALMAKLLPILQELSSREDGRARQLLYALRPYLKPARQEKVERALQLARVIHVGKKFLSGWEDHHV